MLRAELSLDGRGRLLDVGCGPGVIALRLAHLFSEVIGLDADPDMLIEAKRLARDAGIANAHWLHMRETCPRTAAVPARDVRGVSTGWIDRRSPRAVRTMLDPDGVAVQIDAPGYRPDELADAAAAELPHPFPPDDAIVELRRRYLGSDTRAGRGIRNTSPSGEDAVFVDAGFAPARGRRTGRAHHRPHDRRPGRDEVLLVTDRTAPVRRPGRRVRVGSAPAPRGGLPVGTLLRSPPDNVLRIWKPRPWSVRAGAGRRGCARAIGRSARASSLDRRPAAGTARGIPARGRRRRRRLSQLRPQRTRARQRPADHPLSLLALLGELVEQGRGLWVGAGPLTRMR